MESDAELELQHQRSAGARVTQPEVARRVAAIAGRAQVDCQPFDGRHRTGGTVIRIRLVLGHRLEYHATHDREGAHATGACLGEQQQSAGRQEVNPAAGPLGTEMHRAVISQKIVVTQVVGAEKETVWRPDGQSAVVPRPSELPTVGLAGDGMNSRPRPARVQIESPRLGMQRIADDQRPHAVSHRLRPEEFSVLAGQGRDSPRGELAGEELPPVVPVEIDAEDYQHSLVVHAGHVAPAAMCQVDCLTPLDVAGFGVQRMEHSHVGVVQRGQGGGPFGFGERRDPLALFVDCLLPLFGVHTAVD